MGIIEKRLFSLQSPPRADIMKDEKSFRIFAMKKWTIIKASAVLLCFFILSGLYFPFRFGAWTEVGNGWHLSPEEEPTLARTSRGVPDLFEADCAEKGTVLPFIYETCRFDDPSRTAARTAYVYLPYGYDETRAHDLLVLFHGSKDDASSWLLEYPKNKNVADNLIARGDIRPVIIVTPPLFSPEDFGFPDGYDARQTAFELREKLIPALENAFSCASETDPDDARRHRAVAGVSRGAQAVFEAGLRENADLFSRFGAFSGMLTDPSAVAEGLEKSRLDVDLLFSVNGFFDYTFYEHGFRMALLDRMTDKIDDGKNAFFLLIRNGEHSWPSWEAALYHFLLSAFPPDGGVVLPEISSSR